MQKIVIFPLQANHLPAAHSGEACQGVEVSVLPFGVIEDVISSIEKGLISVLLSLGTLRQRAFFDQLIFHSIF